MFFTRRPKSQFRARTNTANLPTLHLENLEPRYAMHHCQISFSAATYSVSESGGQAKITLTRTVAAGDVSFDFHATPGTASSSDFTPVNKTIQWLNSDPNTKTVTVAITSDTKPEPNEKINLSLDNFVDTFAGAITSATLTIKDDDTATNVAPAIGNLGSAISYVHNAAAIVVASGATVTDVDSKNFATGRLRVSITGTDNSTNRLAIGGNFTVNAQHEVFLGAKKIGTRTSNGIGTNDLTITFTTNATPAIVQQLVRAVTFRTAGGAAGARKVNFSVTDGDGGTSIPRTKTVNVT